MSALSLRYDDAAVGPEAVADLSARLSDPNPTMRAWIAYTNGELIGDADPEAALAAVSRGVSARTFRRQPSGRGRRVVSTCALRARAGDVPGALLEFAEVIEHWARLADHTHQLTTLRNLAVLLQRAGAPEADSRVAGHARTGRLDLRPGSRTAQRGARVGVCGTR